jgi:Zinc knuckle
MKSARNEDGEVVEEHALFSCLFKGKCRNCGQIGHKSFQCKNSSNHNDANNSNTTAGNYCTYCRKTGHIKPNCLKLKKKETRYNNNQPSSNNNGNCDRGSHDSQDVVLATTAKNEMFTEDNWICDSGACGYYCNSTRACSILKKSTRVSLWVTAKV